jgi:hypothetical protein
MDEQEKKFIYLVYWMLLRGDHRAMIFVLILMRGDEGVWGIQGSNTQRKRWKKVVHNSILESRNLSTF